MRGEDNQVVACQVLTPLGLAHLEGDVLGIKRCVIRDEGSPSLEIPSLLQPAVAQLNDYFSGNRKSFDLNLNPEGTPFQKRVWDTLSQVPYGKTISYMELAVLLGDPLAIRAVAAANGKNPIWILIPCHRVIGSDGSLTGYAGGLGRKKWLLNHESPEPQQVLF